MKRLNYITVVLLIFLGTRSVFAQYDYPGEKDEETKKEQKHGKYYDSKFFIGGNLGLSFGTYTYIELAPLAGYKITPRLWAGLGPKYMYWKMRNYYETSVYGLKTFASFTILKDISETINIGIGDIFIYLEDETLSLEEIYYDPVNYVYFKGNRNWHNILLAGGGMRFPLGTRGGLSIYALWGLTKSAELLYSNPEIRIGFDF
jgi:hypothetical protein